MRRIRTIEFRSYYFIYAKSTSFGAPSFRVHVTTFFLNDYITYNQNLASQQLCQQPNMKQVQQQTGQHYLQFQQQEGQLSVCLAAFYFTMLQPAFEPSLPFIFVRRHLAWSLTLFLFFLCQHPHWFLCVCHNVPRARVWLRCLLAWLRYCDHFGALPVRI